jgi:hypothetical protein
VRLLVFAVVGLMVMVTAYAFALGGSVAAILFLLVLLMGLVDRVAQPLIARLRG